MWWLVGEGRCGKRARDYIIVAMTEPRDYLRYGGVTAQGEAQRGL